MATIDFNTKSIVTSEIEAQITSFRATARVGEILGAALTIASNHPNEWRDAITTYQGLHNRGRFSIPMKALARLMKHFGRKQTIEIVRAALDRLSSEAEQGTQIDPATTSIAVTGYADHLTGGMPDKQKTE